MRADYLLRGLQRLEEMGLDLSKADVVVRYTDYDPSIPYDMGKDEYTYPDGICVKNGELIIGEDC